MGGTGNLQYVGKKPIEIVIEAFEKSYIFSITSVLKGFPNTFIQAWIGRVPTVNYGVNPDGVFDDQAIGHCNETIDALKCRLSELVGSASQCKLMGGNARDYAIRTLLLAAAPAS
jgi:hypothetical protein